jgi:hypothetical protein
MASTMEISEGAGTPGRHVSRALKTYAFLTAVVAGLLLGVGLRFVPATAAATPDNASGQGAGSTACAAQ